jgi:pheromone shutdown protein TraB
MMTLQRFLPYFLIVAGYLVLAGTADASDHDLTMSVTQIVAQLFVGIAMIAIGAIKMK